MTVEYEWAIEDLDRPDGDDAEIIDVTHADTYAEALKFAAQMEHPRIALVRDRYDAGYSERAWAYVEGRMLPSHLEDASGREVAEVPKRYRTQFDRVTA